MLFFVDNKYDHKQNDTRDHTGGIDSYVSEAPVAKGDKTLNGFIHTGNENTGNCWVKELLRWFFDEHGIKPAEAGTQGGKFCKVGCFPQKAAACAI